MFHVTVVSDNRAAYRNWEPLLTLTLQPTLFKWKGLTCTFGPLQLERFILSQKTTTSAETATTAEQRIPFHRAGSDRLGAHLRFNSHNFRCYPNELCF